MTSLRNSNKEDIDLLLTTQTYNPDIVPKLESYLYSQADLCLPQPYFYDANRTLLKLYQFFPHLIRSECLALAECLSIVYGVDGVDFGSLTCLIPDTFKRNEPFPTLKRCADLLDKCQFREFWETYMKIPSSCPDHEQLVRFIESDYSKTAIRRSILQTISFLYKSTSVIDIVLPFLHFSSIDCLSKFIETDAISRDIVENVVNGKVFFKPNNGNTRRSDDYREDIEFDALHSIMNKMSAGR